MNRLLAGVCTAALMFPATAWAQSTGTQDIEEEAAEEVVVTGTRTNNGVEGILVPDVPKARQAYTQEFIAKQTPGQTILQTINLTPGVNFTQSDAYGSSGGNLRIRGFDGNRISLTQDGIQLNDTGNYAIYANQQLDPELIERVDVNLGQTDVDSPTASAAGGTVNYRTLIPTETLGAMLSPSVGDNDFNRVFAMLNTGSLFSFGTRAFGTASYARNDKFKGPGEIDKQQYNARLYQQIGDDRRNFISISGHYNENRNNFYRNPGLADVRTIFGNTGLAVIDGNAVNDTRRDRFYNEFENIDFCARAVPTRGAADNDGATTPTDTTIAGVAPSTCTNYYNLRINPSDTGNIRAQSRFAITDNFRVSIDPAFQYTLANGGGTFVLRENAPQLSLSTNTALGVDLNGDGDVLDSVRVYTPNNTNTRRVTVTASALWEPIEDQILRVAYTYDRGRHRQTGEYGLIGVNGDPLSVFGGRNNEAAAVLNVNGDNVQGRDRLSIALLNQIAGEYRGEFLDGRALVQLGVRAPFFERNLDQRCFTNAGGTNANIGGIGVGGGFTFCAQGLTLAQTQALGNAGFIAPFERTYKYDAVLPNIGGSFRFTDFLSVFASYAKGFSAPRTDNLYRALSVDVVPERTDSFDLGLRWTSRTVQAQVTGWAINYENRIVTSFDPELGISVDRNVGKVESRGVDAFVAVQPIPQLVIYGMGSYTDATIQDDLLLGFVGTQGATFLATNPTFRTGDAIFAPTAGKQVTETPRWQFGGRVEGQLGPVTLGIQGKYVGDRFATDVNDVRVEDYTLFDLDARLDLSFIGLPRTFIQLNVQNLFDEFWFGNIGTQVNAFQVCPDGTTQSGCVSTATGAGNATGVLSNTGNPNFSVGFPRTAILSLRTAF